VKSAEQFPFMATNNAAGAVLMPLLSVRLQRQQQTFEALGLLDTGAMVNVLPYDLGLRLGAVWEQQTTPVRLSGNLAATEARGLVLQAQVGSFPPVQLAFAWTKLPDVPLILGQVNFFMEFDVCFYRSRSAFEIRPK
jgi:hypothetical protein